MELEHTTAHKMPRPNETAHPIKAKVFKINPWKPIGMLFGWLFLSLFLGLMSIDLAWSFVTNFEETHQDFSIFAVLIGVWLPYIYITFSTFRALVKLFTPYQIVVDSKGIQINTGWRTRAWGKIKWNEIENISFQSFPSTATGWVGMDKLVILLKKDSPHVGIQKITLMKAKYMLQCSIMLFADINELKRVVKECCKIAAANN